MKKGKFGLLLLALLAIVAFKSSQLTYPRVKEAYKEKEATMRIAYQKENLPFDKQCIFIRVFKHENILELWVKAATGKYALLKTYPICRASGRLGPKRKMGDYQVPEGFYHIDRFNPSSSFHLSLGLNYPNASDAVLSDHKKPGGDIFIHGNCVSIGCMAMTDEFIKEIYIAAVEAKEGGQTTIPVHIFPFVMNEANKKQFYSEYEKDTVIIGFWNSLLQGYNYFEKNKQLPIIKVDQQGSYLFK